MRFFCFTILFFAIGIPILTAQADAPAPKPSRTTTRIDSDRADFDMTARQAVYRGDVRVDDPQMKLACVRLVVDLPQTGGRINHIVAETNVVIDFTDEKGQTTHATGDKAVYVYNVQGSVTNETMTLTGNPQMQNTQGTLTGDVIVWDRASNRISATNQKMIFRQNLNGTTAGTNSPPH